ncbi:hypothetical protein ACK3YY_11240 [Aeromonas caviae]
MKELMIVKKKFPMRAILDCAVYKEADDSASLSQLVELGEEVTHDF